MTGLNRQPSWHRQLAASAGDRRDDVTPERRPGSDHVYRVTAI
jgi:hypothetical protein